MRRPPLIWPSILPLSLALIGALLVAAPACRSEPELVELRLFPCEFEGIEPRAVTVEITGYDDAGEVVETYEVGFDDVAAKTFADGYASVGYRKDASVVRARFRVGWFVAPLAGAIDEADAIAVYEELEVPALGQVLTLDSPVQDCAGLIGGDESESGDSIGDSTGDGDGDPTTGDGDGDPTETGDGDGDTSETTDTTDTTDTNTDTTDTDTDTGPDFPEVGDACDVPTGFYCSPDSNPSDTGQALFCDPDTNELVVSGLWPDVACSTDFCVGVGVTVVEGCGNVGTPAVCMCAPAIPVVCAEPLVGCLGDEVFLCHEGQIVSGFCPDCSMIEGGWFQCSF